MKKTICGAEIVLLLLLACLFAWGTALERQQQRISDSVLRLHVTANSDSPEDQNLKLTVRDAVLTAAEPMLKGAQTRDEAETILLSRLPELEQAANITLTEAGSPQRATVSLTRELFGTRHYDTFSLPGGYYDALRVQVGSGEGHNWWCVVYPQLCTTAGLDAVEAGAFGQMTAEDVNLISGEPGYEFRFRSLELVENLLDWIRSAREGIPVSG